MKVRGWGWMVVTVATLLLMMMVWSPVAAQEDGEPFELVIVKFTCETDPGSLGFGFDVPEDCEPTSGVTFEAANADGEVLDTCTIAAGSGGCNVQVPYGISVAVTEDEDTIPEAYAPRENPITIDTPDAPVAGEAPQAIFVNLPTGEDSTGDDTTDDTDTDTDTGTSLPNTGSGPTAGDQSNAGWLALLAVAAFVVGGVERARRRVARQHNEAVQRGGRGHRSRPPRLCSGCTSIKPKPGAQYPREKRHRAPRLPRTPRLFSRDRRFHGRSASGSLNAALLK